MGLLSMGLRSDMFELDEGSCVFITFGSLT